MIRAMAESSSPVLSVDVPSGWDVDRGPSVDGEASLFHPDALISLTAPKPFVRHFHNRHMVGGRFLTPAMAEKYNIDLPEYAGVDQVVEIDPVTGKKL